MTRYQRTVFTPTRELEGDSRQTQASAQGILQEALVKSFNMQIPMLAGLARLL